MILAGGGKVEGLELFDLLDTVAPDLKCRLAALHRKSVSLVKRFGNNEAALEILERIKREVSSRQNSEDYLQLLQFEALADNLEAYVWLRLKDYPLAMEKISSAERTASIIVDKGDFDSEFSRYVVQILLNKAELYMQLKQYPQAMFEYENLLRFASINAPEYFSEVYTVMSLSHFRQKEFFLSLEYSTLARQLILKEASPTRLAVATKVRIASLIECGYAKLA